MPKTATAEPDTLRPTGSKRQRKKQAKLEARVMLKIQQAKKDVKKAKKKFTLAQSILDENQTHLQQLEEKLQHIRTDKEPQAPLTSLDVSEEAPPEAAQAQETSDEVYQEQTPTTDAPTPEADTEAIDAFHNASTAPAEGRTDVASEPETVQTQEVELPAQENIAAPSANEQPLTQAESDSIGEQDTSTQEEFAPESANL